MMEAEVAAPIVARLGERAPDERAKHRNGYRERRWDMRAGTLELFIPTLRAGSYSRASWSRAPAPSSPWWRW
jgi:putative transposase